MKYKVGDLVRVKYGGHKGHVYVVKGIGRNALGEDIYLHNDLVGEKLDNLEPVTHLTTKEFITLVEDMGYEVEGEYRIGVKKDEFSRTLATVSVYDIFELNTISSEFKELQNKELLFKILTLYANTPLELRKEKEKLYTLELPNTTIKERYFRFGLPHAKHSYKFGALPKSTTNSDIDYQTYFTQEEIDQLHNQELIKALKQEPVK